MSDVKMWTVEGRFLLFEGKRTLRLECTHYGPGYAVRYGCSHAFLLHAAERLAEQLNSDGAKP